ncbi:MAG TPA: VOC family protein, partial [Ferruginibacter sp.]|nr:VOC family protein [Ferruginibacter sp.]
ALGVRSLCSSWYIYGCSLTTENTKISTENTKISTENTKQLKLKRFNMNNNIHPCLWYDGKAKEAAEFYCSIFPNSKITTDTPMVVNFEINGKKLMGLNGGPMFKFNPSISMFVTGKTEAEVNDIYDKLIAGGEALMAIGKYDWSERYGWVKDKYGLTWQVMLGNEAKLTPSLLFTGNRFGQAEAAIKLYTSLFDDAGIDVIQYYPAETPFGGKVLFSEFKLDNYNVIAMDGPGEHKYSFNEAVSLVVECKDQEEIDFFWNKLTEGGEESQCGWLKDAFGISWQIIPASLGKIMTDPERGGRAMQALMKMKKLDIATLENA